MTNPDDDCGYRAPNCRCIAEPVFDFEDDEYDTGEHISDTRDRRFKYVALVGTWALVIILACMSMCCTAGYTPQYVRNPEEQSARAVVVRTYCVSAVERTNTIGITFGGYGTGSGTITDHHRVLTAAHVAHCDKPGMSPIIQVAINGRWVLASIERVYKPQRDIAALYVAEDTGQEPIRFSSVPRNRESVCAVIAYPKAHIDCGEYLGTYADPTGEGIDMHIGIAVVPGNSGSGLYNRRGEYIGVIGATELCRPVLDVLTLTMDGLPPIDLPLGIRYTYGPECNSYAASAGAL